MRKNILLCVDLETLLLNDALPVVGVPYYGILRCKTPSEGSLFANEYSFEQIKKATGTKAQRNPIVFEGGCINVHRLADGQMRPEFARPRFSPDYTFRDFCLAASQELQTIARLFEEEASEE